MTNADEKKEFLRYLLQKQILSKTQLQTCLQESTQQKISLLNLLVQKSFLTQESLVSLLEEFKKNSTLSENPTLLLTLETNGSEPSTFKTTLVNTTDFSQEKNSSKKYIASYEILEEIAHGGMGIVYKVRHLELNQIYALKVIRSTSFSPQEMKRFEREAQTTAKLAHPGIVKVFDFGTFEQQYYLCMEYVEGVTLKQKMRQTLSVPKIVEIFIKLLEALEYAHQQGIIHRDLKPSNIFIDSQGNPKLGDFGLAKELITSSYSKNLTKTGEILGTPAYMAPEQLLGDSKLIGVPLDIYAIGACLYESLTQQTPFQGQNIHELFYKILSESPPPPSQWNSKISKDLDRIVLKTLQKARERRYPSAKALAQDLKRFLHGERISIKSPSIAEQCLIWILKHRKRALLLLFVFILGIFVFVYDQYQNIQAQKKAFQQQISAYKHYRKEIEQRLNQIRSSEILLDPRQKIDLLIEANHFVFLAKIQKPEEISLESLQYSIAKDLIRLLCEQNQYLLAKYFLREMKTLKNIPESQKLEQEQFIREAEQQLLTQHQKRFLYWVEQLRLREWNEGLKESALLEISKMQEEPILKQLLTYLEEGKNYFSQTTLRKESEERFYKAMVEALGRLEQPRSGEPILKVLEDMAQNVFKESNKKFSVSEVEYMLELVQAFANSGDRTLLERFLQVRKQGRVNELFWSQTEYVEKYFQEEDGG